MALGPMVVGSGTPALTKDDVTKALGYTPPQQDTTYGNATESSAGLMSAEMFAKLDGLSSGGGITASGTNYIRFEDGTQICWDARVGKNNGDWLAFPIAFKDSGWGISLTNNTGSGSDPILRVAECSGTGFNINTQGKWVKASYVAVGKWK